MKSSPYGGPSGIQGVMMPEAMESLPRVVHERRMPIFSSSSTNRPWTKAQTDPKLCSFSLHVTRRAPPGAITEPSLLQRRPCGPLQKTSLPPQAPTGLGALPTPRARFYGHHPNAQRGGPPCRLDSGSPVSFSMSTIGKRAPLRSPPPPPPPKGLFCTTAGGLALCGGRLGGPWKGIRANATVRTRVILRGPRGPPAVQRRCGHKIR